MYFSRRTPRRRPIALGVSTVLLAGVVVSASPVALASLASVSNDVSSAVRYRLTPDGPQAIGEISDTLFDTDDDSDVVDLPFPINFFGDRYDALCITENGGVFPTNNPLPNDDCDDYDEGVGDLAISAAAPMMAVLALDLDTSETLALGDGRYMEDLYGDFPSDATGQLAGGVLTVTDSAHGLEVGDHVGFIGTGTFLDGFGSSPVTVIDANTFSIAVGSRDDFDPLTGGFQTILATGTWAYSNGVGVPRSIYIGETDVDGRRALAVTWYRVSHNDADNPDDRSSTLQLVLVKADSGDQTVGWDFDVEYNIGTMTDDEDGYDASDPTDDCTAWDASWTEEVDGTWTAPPPSDDARNTCRWGMGFASYVPSIDLDSIEISNDVATITTDGPHGVAGIGIGVRLEIPSDPNLFGSTLYGETVWGQVVDPTTIRIDLNTTANPSLDAYLPADDFGPTDLSGETLPASDVYELFATSSIGDLVDSGGSTALVRNALNSTVFGRYLFGMRNGRMQNFAPPVMNGTPTAGPGVTLPTTGTNPPPPPMNLVEPDRVGGADRAETAVALSQEFFSPGGPVVYLATASNFADALVAGAAAGYEGGPVLLTERDLMPSSTLAELRRLRPSRIVLVGGTSVISTGVFASLAGEASSVVRIGGDNRYETAALVSRDASTPPVPVAYVATGDDYADAIAGGPAAGLDGAPVLLVQRDAIPAATAAELTRLDPDRIVVLGLSAAISASVEAKLAEFAPVVERIGGADRYGTSAALSASKYAPGVEVAFLATGTGFADALAAVPPATVKGGPVLLTRPHCVPQAVLAELQRLRPGRIIVLGGEAAVTAAAANLTACPN